MKLPECAFRASEFREENARRRMATDRDVMAYVLEAWEARELLTPEQWDAGMTYAMAQMRKRIAA